MTNAQFERLRERFTALISLPVTEEARRQEVIRQIGELLAIETVVADSATTEAAGASEPKQDATATDPERGTALNLPPPEWEKLHQAEIAKAGNALLVKYTRSNDLRLKPMKTAATSLKLTADFNSPAFPKIWVFRGGPESLGEFEQKIRTLLAPPSQEQAA